MNKIWLSKSPWRWEKSCHKKKGKVHLYISLQADQEKQAAREKEEAERQAKEAEEKRQKEKADKIREARVRKLSARLPPEPKEEKAEGKPVAQLRFRIPATHTRDEDMTNGEQTKNGKLFLPSMKDLQNNHFFGDFIP